MLIELALSHPCEETVHWSAGTYTDRQGSVFPEVRSAIRGVGGG